MHATIIPCFHNNTGFKNISLDDHIMMSDDSMGLCFKQHCVTSDVDCGWFSSYI